MGRQLFYCRPRFGSPDWDAARAGSLRAMLASSVQRRFPPGAKLLVYDGPPAGGPPGGQLAALAAALRDWGLSITRWAAF